MLIDEVIHTLQHLPPGSDLVSADCLVKRNVQAVVAAMWERQEKYDNVEEVIKTLKVGAREHLVVHMLNFIGCYLRIRSGSLCMCIYMCTYVSVWLCRCSIPCSDPLLTSNRRKRPHTQHRRLTTTSRPPIHPRPTRPTRRHRPLSPRRLRPAVPTSLPLRASRHPQRRGRGSRTRSSNHTIRHSLLLVLTLVLV
jgi:hypothetical protein